MLKEKKYFLFDIDGSWTIYLYWSCNGLAHSKLEIYEIIFIV